jgi:hypothetical protein
MIKENKVSKYILYAIGEIVLVVIGILIALQFNNRNEQKKNLTHFVETIDALEEELLTNYNVATFILSFWNSQDVICKQVLFDELNIADYHNNDLIGILPANWHNFTPKTENLNLLLEYEKSAPKKLKPIIAAVKELQNREKSLYQQWDALHENVLENIKTLTSEVSLARTDSISKNKKFNYMLSNPDYKKIVELYWIRAQIYYDFISRYRAQTMAVLSTIKIIQEDYRQEELEDLYKSKGMNPFTTLNCNPKQPITKNNETRRSYLIGNLSDQDITLRMTNEGKIGGIYILKPNELRNSRPEYAGLDGDYTVIAEQIDSDGNCIQKYVAVNKGYLLIE